MIRVISAKRLTSMRNQLAISTELINDLANQVRTLKRRNSVLVSRVAFLESGGSDKPVDTLPCEVDPQ